LRYAHADLCIPAHHRAPPRTTAHHRAPPRTTARPARVGLLTWALAQVPPRSQLTLQPTWRAISTNKDVRCEGGDPFNMLLKQLDSLVINWMESGVNWVVDVANGVLSAIPFVGSSAIPRFCFPNHPHDPGHDCNKDETEAEQRAWIECNSPDLAGGLDMLCYYKRVRFPTHTHTINYSLSLLLA